MKEKRSLLRRGILAGAMVLAGGGASLAVAAAPAGASNTQMTTAGSFTTFFMMHALFPAINDINPLPETGALTQSIASDSQTCSGGVTYNSTTPPPNGSGAGKAALAAEETAAANEQGCIDFSRSSSPPAPHAETLGLSGASENGDPSPSHLDYYAYALDGVGPLVGTDAPATAFETGPGNGFTLAQIQSIFECKTTNWDQITINGVTGTNSPIAIFWPQAGSGTTAVMTDVLGFSPVAQVSPSVCTSSTAPPNSFTLNTTTVPNEENTEDGIIYTNTLGIPATHDAAGVAIPAGSVAAAAIYMYSAGKFAVEWNDTTDNTSTAQNEVDFALNGSSTPNTMGNFLAGTLTMASMQNTSGSGESYVDLTPQVNRFNQDTNRGTYAVDGNTVSEGNEWYHNLPSNTGGDPSDSNAPIPGVRFVYNATDTVLPGYNGAKDLVGFDNEALGTKSALCNGDDASTITSQGFLPLSTAAAAGITASDAAGATCREFSGLSYPGQGSAIHWATSSFDNRDH